MFAYACHGQVAVEPVEAIRNVGQAVLETGANTISSFRNSVTIEECFGRNQIIQLRPQDEVWLVNARNCHLSTQPCLQSIAVQRRCDGAWVDSSLLELTQNHQQCPTMETVVYIHGNQTDERWSISRGMQVYNYLFNEKPSDQGVRFVIFQWKSERESSRPLNDYRQKASRSILVGKTLARLLCEFQDRNLTVVGYSLGGQVILSAFGDPMMAGTRPGTGYRVALVAPALDCGFLGCLSGFQACGNCVDRTLVFFNENDRVIKLSESVCRKSLGRNGLTTRQALAGGFLPLGQVEFFSLACETGKKHSILKYAATPTFKRELGKLITQCGRRERFVSSIDTEVDTQIAPAIEPSFVTETESVLAEPQSQH